MTTKSNARRRRYYQKHREKILADDKAYRARVESVKDRPVPVSVPGWGVRV